MTPAIKSALTPIADTLTQLEYARDADHCRALFRNLQTAVIGLGDVVADECGVPERTEPEIMMAVTMAGIDGARLMAQAVARPKSPVLSNCRTCAFAVGTRCDSNARGVGAWIAMNCDETGNPALLATGCPGWKAPEPAPETAAKVLNVGDVLPLGHVVLPTPETTSANYTSLAETAEGVARRCGLVRDRHGDYYQRGDDGQNLVIWHRGDGDWDVTGDFPPFADELTALRAYAASVGK